MVMVDVEGSSLMMDSKAQVGWLGLVLVAT